MAKERVVRGLRSHLQCARSASRSLTRSYGCDDADGKQRRLTRSISDTGGLFGTDTETFSLDAVGNRTALGRVSGAWATDANQRFTRRGEGANATHYEYDEAGNLTKKTEAGGRVTLFAYDAHQRLAEVRTGAGQLVARYGYDPLHRRLWKEQFRSRDGSALSPARRSYYLYADAGLIAEAQQDVALNADGSVSSLGAPAITTPHWPMSAPMPGAPFTTGVLAVKTRNSAVETVVAYLQHDHLKTPVQVIDKAGRVVWAANYEPFGRASVMTSPAANAPTIDLTLRLPGQIEDAETGLHYNWQRYYDLETGRYVTRDPVGLFGGENLYAYAGASPISRADPTGLFVPLILPYVLPPSMDFVKNYIDMRNANTIAADKYFHCKANCQAARRGRVGVFVACMISDAREWVDQNIKGDPADASEADQEANRFGRMMGVSSLAQCSVACERYRPRGLSREY